MGSLQTLSIIAPRMLRPSSVNRLFLSSPWVSIDGFMLCLIALKLNYVEARGWELTYLSYWFSAVSTDQRCHPGTKVALKSYGPQVGWRWLSWTSASGGHCVNSWEAALLEEKWLWVAEAGAMWVSVKGYVLRAFQAAREMSVLEGVSYQFPV